MKKHFNTKAIHDGYIVHIGQTEQRKSKELASLSRKLSGLELGLSPETFAHIKEIDLLILKGNTIMAAVEVATSLSTFNKAINDRFRNLITIAPNLITSLFVVVLDDDYSKAFDELHTPANIQYGFNIKIKLIRTSEVEENEFISKLINI